MSEPDEQPAPRQALAPIGGAIGHSGRSAPHVRRGFVAVAMLLAVAPGVGVGSDGDSPTTIVAAQIAMEQRRTAPPCCTGTFHTCSCHVAAEPPATTVPVPPGVSCAAERTVETPVPRGERSRVFRPPRAHMAPSVSEEFQIG